MLMLISARTNRINVRTFMRMSAAGVQAASAGHPFTTRPLASFSTSDGGAKENPSDNPFRATKPRKISKSHFITRELKENPEFFKAFPHLQGPAYQLLHPDHDAQSLEYMNNIRSRTMFDKEDLKSESGERGGYFQSLLHQHNEHMPLTAAEKEEMVRDNEL